MIRRVDILELKERGRLMGQAFPVQGEGDFEELLAQLDRAAPKISGNLPDRRRWSRRN